MGFCIKTYLPCSFWVRSYDSLPIASLVLSLSPVMFDHEATKYLLFTDFLSSSEPSFLLRETFRDQGYSLAAEYLSWAWETGFYSWHWNKKQSGNSGVHKRKGETLSFSIPFVPAIVVSPCSGSQAPVPWSLFSNNLLCDPKQVAEALRAPLNAPRPSHLGLSSPGLWWT